MAYLYQVFVAFGNLFHLSLHGSAQIWLVQVDAHRLVRHDQAETELVRLDVLAQLLSIASLLHSLDMLMDRRVCADTILVHLGDEITFRQQVGRFGSRAYTSYQGYISLAFLEVGRQLLGVPSVIGVHFKVVQFVNDEAARRECLTRHIHLYCSLMTDGIFRNASQEVFR